MDMSSQRNKRTKLDVVDDETEIIEDDNFLYDLTRDLIIRHEPRQDEEEDAANDLTLASLGCPTSFDVFMPYLFSWDTSECFEIINQIKLESKLRNISTINSFANLDMFKAVFISYLIIDLWKKMKDKMATTSAYR